jgi:hypothetical protein
MWSRAASHFVWKYLADSTSYFGSDSVDDSLKEPHPVCNWIKVGSEHKQMPAFTAGGGENKGQPGVFVQDLKRRDCEFFCARCSAVVSIEINRCPATGVPAIPWVETDPHLVICSTGNAVPRPTDYLFNF